MYVTSAQYWLNILLGARNTQKQWIMEPFLTTVAVKLNVNPLDIQICVWHDFCIYLFNYSILFCPRSGTRESWKRLDMQGVQKSYFGCQFCLRLNMMKSPMTRSIASFPHVFLFVFILTNYYDDLMKCVPIQLPNYFIKKNRLKIVPLFNVVSLLKGATTVLK